MAGLLAPVAVMLLALPALAHHPLGGRAIATGYEGFMSGLAHPIIGLDHLAFVVASGLVAVRRPWGAVVPVAFAIAALAGTGLHLQAVDLPLLEGTIALSVLAMGILLAWPQRFKAGPGATVALAIAALIAGIFHGYAYGEAVVGVEMAPIAFYLAGFTAVQLAIALGVRTLANRLAPENATPLRYAGFAIAGIGAAYLASALGA
ncbi:MAG: HupE/UreJ family protein [Cyanophyceae cyanobacterium]